MHTQNKETKRKRDLVEAVRGRFVRVKETKEASTAVEERHFETRPNDAFHPPSGFQLHPDNFLHHSPHRPLNLLR